MTFFLRRKKFFCLQILLIICLVFFENPYLYAKASFDSLSFKPTTDYGYYLTTEQSQTLGQGNYALGLMTEFSNDSVVADTFSKSRIRDIVNEQVAMHLSGSVGLWDWLNTGLLASFVPYQVFNSLQTGASDNGARMGDI